MDPHNEKLEDVRAYDAENGDLGHVDLRKTTRTLLWKLDTR